MLSAKRTGAWAGRRLYASNSHLAEFRSKFTSTFGGLEAVCKSVAQTRKFNEKGSSGCAPYFALAPGSHPYRDHVTGDSLANNTQKAVDRLRSMVGKQDSDFSRKYNITPAEYAAHVEDLARSFPKETVFSPEYEAWLQEHKGYTEEDVEKHRWTYEKVLNGESLLRERSQEERDAEGASASLYNTAELKEKGDNVLSAFEESMLNTLESSQKALSLMGVPAKSIEANRQLETNQTSLERHKNRWDELYASAIDREEVVEFRKKFEAMLRVDPRVDASILLLLHYKSILPSILSQLDSDTDDLPVYQQVLWELNVNNKALSDFKDSDYSLTFLQFLDKLPHIRDQLSTEIDNQEYDISVDKYQMEIDEKPELLRLSRMNREELNAFVEETHDAAMQKIQSDMGSMASSADLDGEDDSDSRKKQMEGMEAISNLQAKIDAHKRAQEKEEEEKAVPEAKSDKEEGAAAAATTAKATASTGASLSEAENEALFNWIMKDIKDDVEEEVPKEE